MNLPVFSTLVSFLDINDFSDSNGHNKLLSQLLTSEKEFVVSAWLKHSKFVLPVLSTIISFLDINDFQDCYGEIELFSDLSNPVKLFVLVFWLKHTHFSAVGDSSFIFYTRNKEVHRSNDEPAVVIQNRQCEWFSCGMIYRKRGKPAIVYENGSKVMFFNGKMASFFESSKTVLAK